MSTLRQIKKRIRSIESTRKIARAMELVSVNKLRKVEDRAHAMRPYVGRMDEILKNVVAAAEDFHHPLLDERREKKALALCVLTSDSGLCGSYNNNILRLADGFVRQQPAETKIHIVAVGKKGFSHFRGRGFALSRSFIGLNGRYQENVADEITRYLQEQFLTRTVDEVHVAYTRFETNARHCATVEKFLNISLPGARVRSENFIWEPSRGEIFAEVMAEFLILKLRSYLLQSFVCEHSSRIIAMSMAKENAKELLENLILQQNKLRQALITKDVSEIVGAAEALKG